MDDILIRGGTVVDGTGGPGRVADVAVRDGRIAAVEPGRSDGAARTIDAHGMVVAPGFIDIHTHSDFSLPLNPRAEAKIRQGVTTEVVGNCGISVAPALPGKVEMLARYLSASAPWLSFEETDFARYMDGWPAIAVNTVMQVGHNTIRLMAMGTENRAPRADEMAHMEAMLAEGLEAGALGLSSGLFTTPGCYAGREEMRALGRVLKAHGGRYSSHVRDEADGVHDAIAEAIDVGEHAGIHVQLAHMKLSGTARWGEAARLLKTVADARARGVDVHGDQYPYDWASNPLRFLLPTWTQEGGLEAMLARLADPYVRARIRQKLAEVGFNNFGQVESWADIRIAISPTAEAGRTIEQIARERGCDPLDAVCDIIVADKGATRIIVRSMSEADVRTIVANAEALVGSDGPCVAPYGITGQGKPHPRLYGTFPRVIGLYARDLGLLSLPQAIRKMTGGAAEALGMPDRGLLRTGQAADVVVFDPATIAERATYDDPHQYAAGIETVIVNGTIAIDGGEHTGALPGRVLRRRGTVLG
ncbi:MAG: amidohydrolase family protein [Alphaproteobacteria bacterium]